MAREISNYDDTINSRDVIARIEELEDLEDEERTEEDDTELALLRKFSDQASDYASDWPHGVTLIRDSYFEKYAKEHAEEGDDKVDDWPYNCIDWKKAAEDLQTDYTAIEFDGITYWVL
jgi:hypothetical protein